MHCDLSYHFLFFAIAQKVMNRGKKWENKQDFCKEPNKFHEENG